MKLKSKRIVTEDEIIQGSIEIEEGKIKRIYKNDPTSCDVDYGDAMIIPGIFDTHNHGTFGYGLRMDDGPEAEKMVKGYLKGLASQGVTCIFPTSGPKMIKTCARLAKEQQDGAKILGIHSEGPWLNRVGEKGIRTGYPEVSLDFAKQMVKDGDGLLRLVALAPEIPDIDPILNYFIEEGVTVAFAHSDCNYAEANAAIDKGISVATHLSNVMTGLHHRDIGGFGACLLRDEVHCELICDGLHVSLPMIKIILKVKDHDQVMMISDCSEMAGAPVGTYRRTNSDGTTVDLSITPEGFCLSDTGRLMGSSKPVLYGISNLIEKLHMCPVDVCHMSSLTAAKKYGYPLRGSIAQGKYADFVVLNPDYTVKHTYSEGRIVYDEKTDKDLFNTDFLERIRVK